MRFLDSVRPQVLFYNKAIFDEYGIDPEMMKTMDGYIEAGRQLKEKSNGEVYLSYIDPNQQDLEILGTPWFNAICRQGSGMRTAKL